jgi:hypothetical protein
MSKLTVYIGSCTGGKTEDFMAVAKVFLASVRAIYLFYLFHDVIAAGLLGCYFNAA